ncbi:pilin [Xanthomonas phage JGB6]|nr:pilin [Xanthomonas phage JGB6]
MQRFDLEVFGTDASDQIDLADVIFASALSNSPSTIPTTACALVAVHRSNVNRNTSMTNFLYQAAQDAARAARRVYTNYFKLGTPVVGEQLEPECRVKVELGYTRKWRVEGVERSEFVTSKHLNKVLEAYLAKNLQHIVEQAVIDLEIKAHDLAVGSVEQLRAELARVEALRPTDPEVA